MGRDVDRDEGSEQALWRDLVARLEIPAPIDPADAPWPDRENLQTRSTSGTGNDAGASVVGDTSADSGHADGSADRGRVIRSAGPTRSCDPTGEAEVQAADGTAAGGGTEGTAAGGGPDSAVGPGSVPGPRDYELDESGDADNWDDYYVPPPVPPQPKLDPVAKGAWIALFGGPGYLMLATLLSWPIAGWEALCAVAAFVTGFVVLVIRLGDGPSKRDGPDQGAVV